jgi:molybdopterin biosynthesis enzyme
MLAGLPCAAEDFGIIPDTLDALTSALASTREHDIVVTTGGASVGDHDLVKPALEAAGGSIDFWKIRMRPGKPLIAGTLGKALFLGLPGNPVSAYVTATLFLLPLVRSMAGCPDPRPKMRRAVLGAAMPPGRRTGRLCARGAGRWRGDPRSSVRTAQRRGALAPGRLPDRAGSGQRGGGARGGGHRHRAVVLLDMFSLGSYTFLVRSKTRARIC